MRFLTQKPTLSKVRKAQYDTGNKYKLRNQMQKMHSLVRHKNVPNGYLVTPSDRIFDGHQGLVKPRKPLKVL